MIHSTVAIDASRNIRLYGLMFLFFIAGTGKLSAQPNLLLSTPGYRHLAMPMSVFHFKGALYTVNCYRKDVRKFPHAPLSSRTSTALYTITKKDLRTNALQSASVVGDTTQPDSCVGVEVVSVIANDRINLFYTKNILVDTSRAAFYGGQALGLYTTQLDTNLNVTISDKLLRITSLPKRVWGITTPRVSSTPERLLVAYQQWDSITGNLVRPMVLQLDFRGNVLEEDTVGVPVTLPAAGYTDFNYVEQIIPLGHKQFMVAGKNLFPSTAPYAFDYRFYLADSAFRVIDTFLIKRRDFGLYPTETGGNFLNPPEMYVLPTGSIIAGGIFEYMDWTKQGFPVYNHTALARMNPANRYTIDTYASFKGKDAADLNHFNGWFALHNMAYNRHENLIYYANATHKSDLNSCEASTNYIQVICVDTFLRMRWRKFISLGQGNCALAGHVSAPEHGAGVLIAGYASSSSNPGDTSRQFNFAFFVDSTTQTTAAVAQTGMPERIRVAPNPVGATLTVTDARNVPGRIRLLDAPGRLVLEKNYESGRPLDVSSLKGGIYMAEVSAEDGTIQWLKVHKTD